jgi:hypothetical protein
VHPKNVLYKEKSLRRYKHPQEGYEMLRRGCLNDLMTELNIIYLFVQSIDTFQLYTNIISNIILLPKYYKILDYIIYCVNEGGTENWIKIVYL